MRFLRFTCVLCSVLLLSTAATTCVASDDEAKVQFKANDSIVATVTGNLLCTWKPGKLHYACVRAGGTEIELDPAECPIVIKELLELRNTQGGGAVSTIQVEAKGNLVFEERPNAVEHRSIAKGDPGAVVPVLRVQSIKITTLPRGMNIGPLKRDREEVTSTTVRITKP